MSEPAALTFAISADYARRTGGFIYNEHLLAGLVRLGWRIDRLILPAGFPHPDPAARAASAAALRALPDGTLVLIDQLCLGVLPEVAAAEGARLRLVMIVHHPLALERYGPTAEAAQLAACERSALAHVAAALVTSPTTAATLTRDYGVPASRIIVAPPGVAPAPLAHGSQGPDIGLLSVGAVVPRKDHGALLAALAGLRDLPWRLTIAGNLDRAPAHVAGLRRRIVAGGLGRRVTLAGEVSDAALARAWDAADLFVSSSAHEGYGMAVAEAFAHGVPVVTTAAGAVGAWVGRRGALVVPGGQIAQLRAALRAALENPALRAALRAGAVARRRALPSWDSTAAIADHNLRSVPQTRS